MDSVTVGDAREKLCPFIDTQRYCATANCMACVYTNEYSKEQCCGSQILPEKDKEGYCNLTRKD